MSALQTQTHNAGYILALKNQTDQGAPLTLLTHGGDGNKFQSHTPSDSLSFCVNNNLHYILLYGESAVDILKRRDKLASYPYPLSLVMNTGAEEHVPVTDLQFHKLNALMTLRPVSLQAAFDAAAIVQAKQNLNIAQDSQEMQIRSRQRESSFAALRRALQPSLDELNDFSVATEEHKNSSVKPLLEGYLAIRRDKTGQYSYIASSNYGREHRQVKDLGSAFHYAQARDALLALHHFCHYARAGDSVYVAKAQYAIDPAPVSIEQMEAEDLHDDLAFFDPEVRQIAIRLSQSRLKL